MRSRATIGQAPNPRVQRTRVARCARPGSPLTRHPLGGSSSAPLEDQKMISGGFKATLGGSLLSALVVVGGCSLDSSPSRQREAVARVLDAYAQAMKTGDYSSVDFTPDVTFVGPLTNGPIIGEAQVQDFLRKVSTGVRDIRVKRQIIDGEFASVIADLETKEGTIVPFAEFFRVVDGRIAEIRPYSIRDR